MAQEPSAKRLKRVGSCECENEATEAIADEEVLREGSDGISNNKSMALDVLLSPVFIDRHLLRAADWFILSYVCRSLRRFYVQEVYLKDGFFSTVEEETACSGLPFHLFPRWVPLYPRLHVRVADAENNSTARDTLLLPEWHLAFARHLTERFVQDFQNYFQREPQRQVQVAALIAQQVVNQAVADNENNDPNADGNNYRAEDGGGDDRGEQHAAQDSEQDRENGDVNAEHPLRDVLGSYVSPFAQSNAYAVRPVSWKAKLSLQLKECVLGMFQKACSDTLFEWAVSQGYVLLDRPTHMCPYSIQNYRLINGSFDLIENNDGVVHGELLGRLQAARDFAQRMGA